MTGPRVVAEPRTHCRKLRPECPLPENRSVPRLLRESVKLSRYIAAFAATTVVLVSAFASAGAATAATPGVTYVPGSSIAAVANYGDPGWGTTSFTVSSGLSGVTFAAGAHLAYGFSAPLDATTGTALTDIASSSSYTSAIPSDFYPEIDLFADGVSVLGVLFPAVAAGTVFSDATALWQSSIAIGAIAGGTSATLAAFDLELAADPALSAATVIGLEMFGPNATTLSAYEVNGTQFIFTPAPVFTAPTSISLADYTTAGKGITIATNGFLPNESIDVYYSTPNNGGQLTTIAADANGAVSFNYVETDPATIVGAYQLTFVGSVPNPQFFDFAVVATLAATGLNLMPPIVIAAALLAIGAAFVIIARRRRTT